MSEAKTAVEQVSAILLDLDERRAKLAAEIKGLTEQLDQIGAERLTLAKLLTLEKPPKPARKPRTKKTPTTPPANDVPLPPGIVRYRSGYRVEGSKVTHVTLDAAVAAKVLGV